MTTYSGTGCLESDVEKLEAEMEELRAENASLRDQLASLKSEQSILHDYEINKPGAYLRREPGDGWRLMEVYELEPGVFVMSPLVRSKSYLLEGEFVGPIKIREVKCE